MLKYGSLQDHPIVWRKITCETCNGTGGVVVTREGFKDYLDNFYRYGKFNKGEVWRWALNDYRIWKLSGTIDCVDCNGAGKWSVPS